MAEKIISPGVFTNEIDQTFLPAAVADIGAALVGPTLKGPAGVPTVVTSFSDFQAKFGDVFKSGSDSVQFLTSHAAEEYLKNSDTLTVVRVMDGTFAPASASILTAGSTSTTGNAFASGSIVIGISGSGERYKITEADGTVVTFIASADGGGDASDDSIRFFEANTGTSGQQVNNLRDEINAVGGLSIVASARIGANGSSPTLFLTSSVAGTAFNGTTFVT